MHDGFCLCQHSDHGDICRPPLTAAVIARHQRMCAITWFEESVQNYQSFTPCYALAQEENVAATLRFILVFAHGDFCDVLIG